MHEFVIFKLAAMVSHSSHSVSIFFVIQAIITEEAIKTESRQDGPTFQAAYQDRGRNKHHDSNKLQKFQYISLGFAVYSTIIGHWYEIWIYIWIDVWIYIWVYSGFSFKFVFIIEINFLLL